MKEIEDFREFNEFFKSFEKNIITNNLQTISNSLKSIDPKEELILKSYHKRKKEGVYYTDEKITDSIFSEALLLFLKKKISFIQLKNVKDIFELNSEQKKQIFDILLTITVCDPACGSGVFLLSAAKILFNLIKKINPQLNKSDVKTKILKNINGLDINEFGIKLCILKLFKWYFKDNEADLFKIISILKSNLRVENSLTVKNSSKFDIIIGNPPYGNILEQDVKNILKKENIYYNVDIYCAFLLKALDWSKGLIGLLVPKSFLLRQGYIVFRNRLLSTANLLKIFDIGSKLFKRATNEVQIVFYEKKESNENKSLEIYDYPDKKIISYNNKDIDKLKICFNLNCPLCVNSKKLFVYTFKNKCPYCGSKTDKLFRIRIKPNDDLYQIINRIENAGDLNYLNPIDFPRMVRGEEDKGLKEVKNILKDNLEGSCFFINAKDDFKYYFINKRKSLNIEKIDSFLLKGEEYEYYVNPKLLIKHNNIVPEAIYSENSICFTSSIYSLLHDDLNELKYICAVLNSALIQFYCTYGINSQKDTTINLNQYMIRHLPIIKPEEKLRNEITLKVDQIIRKLQENNGELNKEINIILKKIDQIIFNLFSLNEQEINIIISNIKGRINYFNKLYK